MSTPVTEPLDTSAEEARAAEQASQDRRLVEIGVLRAILDDSVAVAERRCAGPRSCAGRALALAIHRSREP